MIFRELKETEEEEFRQWMRDNYATFIPDPDIHHPGVVDEYRKLQEENNKLPLYAKDYDTFTPAMEHHIYS
jgi:hypothetical protein